MRHIIVSRCLRRLPISAHAYTAAWTTSAHPHGNSRETAGQGRRPGWTYNGPDQGVSPAQGRHGGRVGLHAGDSSTSGVCGTPRGFREESQPRCRLTRPDMGSGVVSRWMGHSSIKITVDRYGHLTLDGSDRCRQVIEATFGVHMLSGPPTPAAPAAEPLPAQPGSRGNTPHPTHS